MKARGAIEEAEETEGRRGTERRAVESIASYSRMMAEVKEEKLGVSRCFPS
jgi:hypothetical protein